MHAPECPQCRVPLAVGFLVDRAHANSPGVIEWVGGPVERGFFGLKLRGRERVPTVTYRCPRCGLLQSYARPGQ